MCPKCGRKFTSNDTDVCLECGYSLCVPEDPENEDIEVESFPTTTQEEWVINFHSERGIDLRNLTEQERDDIEHYRFNQLRRRMISRQE